MEDSDVLDSTVLSLHNDVSLRTKLGRYLTAMPTNGDGDESKRRESGIVSSSSGAGAAPFVLGVDGQGVGDPLDCLNFISLDSPGRDFRGPLRYGMTVAIKVSAAKDRFLGVRSAGATKVMGTMPRPLHRHLPRGDPCGILARLARKWRAMDHTKGKAWSRRGGRTKIQGNVCPAGRHSLCSGWSGW